jgi:hypothetical protein
VSRHGPGDLEPAERLTHLLLSAVPPRTLPLGFRDEVMRRVGPRGAAAWEWIAAAVLALPALAYIAVELATQGEELSSALNNVIGAAGADNAEAFFFVDGSMVLALTVLGIASLIAAHAAIVSPARRTASRR